MFGYPNASLWYVPLIVGCYAAFPLLTTLVLRQRTRADLLRLLLAGLAIEGLCRAVALYALDGMPVGYGHGFWPGLPRLDARRDLLPASFPFQLWAPFGLFLTRIGEFLAGMIAAELFVRDESRVTGALLGPGAALAGLLIWLGGNALLYVGLWGWIMADALIALGLTLTLLNLAALTRHALRRLFRGVEACGRWSQALFLTHLMVMYVYAVSYPRIAGGSPWLTALLLVLTALAIGAACWLLRRFERSRWPGRIIRVTIGKLWIDTTKDRPVETSQSLRPGS
jgi:peptidoglycan/LPS O-acetylase OafA/YrhL